MDRENLHDWNRNLILIHSKMKCIFLPSSGKTCIKDRNGNYHCISVIHPVQPYRECPFLLNDECSPDIIVYLRHSYGEESIVQPKHVYYVVFAMSSQPYPTVHRYTGFCNWASHMLPTVYRIQSLDKVSIVFSTEFVSISFAETNNIGAFT